MAIPSGISTGTVRISTLDDFKTIVYGLTACASSRSSSSSVVKSWAAFCEQPSVEQQAGPLSRYSTIYGTCLNGLGCDKKARDFMAWYYENLGEGKRFPEVCSHHLVWRHHLDMTREMEFRGWSIPLTTSDLMAKKGDRAFMRGHYTKRKREEYVRLPAPDVTVSKKSLSRDETARILLSGSRKPSWRVLKAMATFAYQMATGLRHRETCTLLLSHIGWLDPARHESLMDGLKVRNRQSSLFCSECNAARPARADRFCCQLQGPDKERIAILIFAHHVKKGGTDDFKTALLEHRDPRLCSLFMLAMYIFVRSDEQRGWSARIGNATTLFEVAESDMVRDPKCQTTRQGAVLLELMRENGIKKSTSTHLGHATVMSSAPTLGVTTVEAQHMVRHTTTMTGDYQSRDICLLPARARLAGHVDAVVTCERARTPERQRPGALTGWIASVMELRMIEPGQRELVKGALAGVLLSALPYWPADSFPFGIVQRLRSHPNYISHCTQLRQPTGPPTPVQLPAPVPLPLLSTQLQQIPASFKVSVTSYHAVATQMDQPHPWGTIRDHLEKQEEAGSEHVDWAKSDSRGEAAGWAQWRGWQRFAFQRLYQAEKRLPPGENAVDKLEMERVMSGKKMKEVCLEMRKEQKK